MLKKSLIIISALCLCTPLLAETFFEPLGPIAAEQKDQMIKVFSTIMIAVLPVLIGVPIILFRYRRGGSGKYRPEFENSRRLEYVVWGLPVVLTLVLAYWLVVSVNRLDPYKPLGNDPMRIQVIGLDWKWLFIYPDQNVASVGTLAIPAGQAVVLDMTTDTVMQSLLIPQLAGQVYAMPGMVTQLNLMADAPATTIGYNSQYNGDEFTKQVVNVQALSKTDFDAWVSGASNAPTLDAASYAVLGNPGNLQDAQKALGMPDTRLQLGDANLFHDVVMRYNDGQAVASSAQPGSSDYKAGGAQ